MRFIFLMLLTLVLTSCSAIPDWMAPTPPWKRVKKVIPVIHSEEATSVVQRYAVQMEYENNLHLEHAKTCYNEEGITKIQLEFITQDLIELCDARKLIVDMTENFLGKLNQDTILGPEFAAFPMRPENLEIYIVYESYFGKYVDPRYLYWINLEEGTVSFYTWELKYDANRCWKCKKEAYGTSREIVLYQHAAELEYEDLNPPKKSAFGSERYYPEDD
ncbi:MAG: hypothetical protein H0X29_11040 [Parachlamydiaceae bacterium]|nr:hypothetical protein [Parachlamydiaceae bacterium]